MSAASSSERAFSRTEVATNVAYAIVLLGSRDTLLIGFEFLPRWRSEAAEGQSTFRPAFALIFLKYVLEYVNFLRNKPSEAEHYLQRIQSPESQRLSSLRNKADASS